MVDIDVRLSAVTKRFGSAAPAVDALDLEVMDGEFFSLLGPSGCGKTTTLRMIGGFEDPTSGRIELAGKDVTFVPAHRRQVNTVFQSYALFPHLSIYENVAFGLRRRRVPDAEVRTRVPEMLELVALRGLEQRRPSQISGGQAQRVALARALINRPAVLLLDEPLGALDLLLRKQMQLELKRIQREVGITFIYVTHDQEEALTMSDRIGVMNRGRLEQLGAPEELYERPLTRFVATFLGASNLLEAVVASIGDALADVRLSDGTALSVPSRRLDSARRVAVGVRPEKIRLLATDGQPAEAATNRLTGTVIASAYSGVSTVYEVRADTGDVVRVYAQNVERAETSHLRRAGERVVLAWRPSDTFVVPSAIGPPPGEARVEATAARTTGVETTAVETTSHGEGVVT